MKGRLWAAALSAALWVGASVAMAQETGSVAGIVRNASGEPVADVVVSVAGTRLRARTDASGAFRIDAAPAGDQVVAAESRRHGISAGHVEVPVGGTVDIELVLDPVQHHEEVLVTASADGRTASEMAQPASVLAGTELALRQQATLGETLDQTPGVSSTYFGPGSSRPVIRGLGGERIRVLQGGLGVADASGTSPDHAVAVDPLTARQIEVLRGPATLLYGSSAIGGAVNVVDARVPQDVPDRPATGLVRVNGGTAADELAGGVSVDGGKGSFAWHVDAQRRNTDDVSIPGLAESPALRAEEEEEDEEHEQAEGVLPNSALENTSLGFGASWVRESGFLGLAVSGFDSLYGVPGHEHHGEGEEHHEDEEDRGDGEEGIRVDLRQRRVELRGERVRPLPGFASARIRAAYTDYEHRELEGDVIGTTFTNESWEARLEGRHHDVGPFRGTVGVQVGRRDFTAVGEEAFVPPTLTDQLAAFVFEEARGGNWRFQLGGRVERHDVGAEEGELRERDFTSVSGSLGLVWERDENVSVGLSVARSVRAPTAEELFSNGPHLATGLFEIGDPDLGKERSLGLDVSVRKREGRLTGEVNVFYNRFSDFIYERVTDDEEDGLPVAMFLQDDARFWGGEASARLDIVHREPRHLDLEVEADVVRAELVDGDPLPRIPPARLGVALHYHDIHWNAQLGVRHVTDQDRVAIGERPTDGYTMLNASVGRRFFLGGNILDVMLRGTNLNDTEARSHVSFLKDVAPLPGRDIRLVAQLTF